MAILSGARCVPRLKRVVKQRYPCVSQARGIRSGLRLYNPARASSTAGIPYNRVVVGVPKESHLGERRVAVTPAAVATLTAKGFNVQVESGAGILSNFKDADYEKSGATIVNKGSAFESDVVLKFKPPNPDESNLFRDEAHLFSLLYPNQNQDLIKALSKHNMTAFALDCMPKIPQARPFDVVTPMENIAGYKAVIEASHHFGKTLGGQVSPTGNFPPAKVLVIGSSGAAMAAIKQASDMGAIVRVIGADPSLRSTLKSMSVEIIDVEKVEGSNPNDFSSIMAKIEEQCSSIDVIISAVYGSQESKAPILISKAIVEKLNPGSVVVDLAATNGGNIEITKPGEIIQHNGVTNIGLTDFSLFLPTQVSTLYSNAISKFLMSMEGDKDHFLVPFDNDVVKGCMILNKGKINWPIKIVQVTKTEKKVSRYPPIEVDNFNLRLQKAIMYTAGSLAILGIGSPNPTFTSMTTTFGLSAIVGYHSIWSIHPPIVAPLMAFNVAVSGIEAIGGLYLMGGGYYPTTPLEALSAAAVFCSFVNIFGGLVASGRMLSAIRRVSDPSEHKYLYGLIGGSFLSFYALGAMNDIPEIHKMAYLVSSLFCVGAVSGLTKHTTSRNLTGFGFIGLAGGMAATIGTMAPSYPVLMQMAGVAIAGALTGTAITKLTDVTRLSPLVVAYHSLVGVAAVLTCLATYADHFPHFTEDPSSLAQKIALFVSTFVGGVTISGSALAYCKIVGMINPAPVLLAKRHAINASLLAGNLAALAYFLADPSFEAGMVMMGTTAVLSTAMGLTLAMPVGSADMPVVVTSLNSISGWAICAEGFMLNNTLLTVIGSLIGSTGYILSHRMSKAQNRSILNVLKGGVGMLPKPEKLSGIYTEWNLDETRDALTEARNIIIVPGFGLIAGRGQYPLAKIVNLLRKQGKNVRYGVHPVGGRMFGQLNVLVPQSGIDHDIIYDLKDINPEFQRSDLVLVVGANDTINCGAEEDPDSEIAGMPVLQVWKSKQVVVINESPTGGYACSENPTFYKPNTAMLLGHSANVCEGLLQKLKDHYELP